MTSCNRVTIICLTERDWLTVILLFCFLFCRLSKQEKKNKNKSKDVKINWQILLPQTRLENMCCISWTILNCDIIVWLFMHEINFCILLCIEAFLKRRKILFTIIFSLLPVLSSITHSSWIMLLCFMEHVL
jgi:hypothetical protein